jgi:hypothetical protein
MAISVTIPTTAVQDAKLERIRVRQNAHGENYATVDAMAKQKLIDVLLGMLGELDHDDNIAAESAYKQAFLNASPEIRAQIKALLGL